jgi:hypothetical protein
MLARLTQLKPAWQKVPVIPNLRDAQDSTQKSRIGATNFVIASILLPPIIAANAQMTGLVLSEVLPPVRPLLGIPIPLVVAAIVVLAEAAIGILHSAEAESRVGTERAFTLMTAVWTIAGFGVIAIEAMLYGIVQPGNVLRIPIAGSVFGLVGGLLGLAVFGLGRLWHHSLITLRKERTARVVAKQLVALKHAAEEWNSLAQRVAPHQTDAVVQFERLATLAGETANLQVAAVSKVHAEFERHRAVLPNWATQNERSLSDAEFQERESRVYLWLLILLVAVVSLATVSGFSARRLTPVFGAAVGLGTGVAAFSMGTFAAQATSRSSRARAIVLAALGTITVVLAGMSARFLRGEVSLHGIVLGIPAVGAFLSGVQIGRDSSLLRLPGWMLVRLVAMIPLISVTAIIFAINVSVVLVEYLLAIIAWPVTALLRFRRGPSAVEHAPAQGI